MKNKKIVTVFEGFIKPKKDIEKFEDLDLDLNKPINLFLSKNRNIAEADMTISIIVLDCDVTKKQVYQTTNYYVEMNVINEKSGTPNKLVFDIGNMVMLYHDSTSKITYIASTNKEGAMVIYNHILLNTDDYPELEKIKFRDIPQLKK